MLDRPPWALAADKLGLVEPVGRFSESIIKTVVHSSRGRFRAEFNDPIRVDQAQEVRTVVGVVDGLIERPRKACTGTPHPNACLLY